MGVGVSEKTPNFTPETKPQSAVRNSFWYVVQVRVCVYSAQLLKYWVRWWYT
jgi:hypothetical protein